MDTFPPQCGRGYHYYYYYNAAPLPRNPNSQNNIRDVLTCKGKLNIQKPEPFYGHDSHKWRTFLTQCLTMFQAKPLTFQLESSCVAFTALYLQGIAFDHYMVLLRFDSNSLVLSNWQAFAQEFLSKFGVFDTIAEAKENLLNLQMHNNKQFTTFIDVLHLAPKQSSYNGYKALVTQIDQWYWEDCSKYLVPCVPWNSSENSNWKTRAAAGNQTTSAVPPPNPAA
ncbi:hypothetical protein C0993_007458 [Termitomyces sp. T159_Od127]|nr:hypothetical protein C0993_007458 [Termitomyces sp. T159_Od127]